MSTWDTLVMNIYKHAQLHLNVDLLDDVSDWFIIGAAL
jgi:hypothetical protein